MIVYKSAQFLMLPKQNIALQILCQEADVYCNNKIQTKNLRLWKPLIKTTSLWKQDGFLIYSLEQ